MESHAQPESAASDEGAKQAVDQDHERLHAISRRIQHSASDGAALAAALEEFHTALVDHFSNEEYPQGVLAALARRAPAEREAFAEILAEHESFLSNVQELLSQARDGKVPAAGLAARATMLARILGEHERRERAAMSALVQSRPAPPG